MIWVLQELRAILYPSPPDKEYPCHPVDCSSHPLLDDLDEDDYFPDLDADESALESGMKVPCHPIDCSSHPLLDDFDEEDYCVDLDTHGDIECGTQHAQTRNPQASADQTGLSQRDMPAVAGPSGASVTQQVCTKALADLSMAWIDVVVSTPASMLIVPVYQALL